MEGIEKGFQTMENSQKKLDINTIGNAFQYGANITPSNYRRTQAGTLYTSIINISDGQFLLIYKLNKEHTIKLDLNEEFRKSRAQKIVFDVLF